MDFDLSEEQSQLQDELRRMLASRCTADVRRAAQGLPGAVDRELWQELADTGVFALRLAEVDGGVGLGLADATVVLEELGRAAVPGPLVWTCLAAGLIDGAATGASVVGGVMAGGRFVEHLDALDALVVLDASGVRRVEPSAIQGERARRPLDPLTPVHVVPTLPEGERVGDADVAARWHRDGAVLIGALQVGLGAAAVDLATTYAKQRQQFGRPIGSFQALKHLLADALTQVEVARAAVQAAAVIIDEGAPEDEARRAASGARVVAARAADRAGRTCVQVHGGMGYTWEVEAHLLLKRAMVLDTTMGSTDDAIDAVASTV